MIEPSKRFGFLIGSILSMILGIIGIVAGDLKGDIVLCCVGVALISLAVYFDNNANHVEVIMAIKKISGDPE